MEYSVKSVSGLDDIALELLERFPQHRIWLLNGEMGAGKTTFVAALGRVLGVKDAVSSPTFPIIQEYGYTDEEGGAAALVHMDLYRLQDLAEAMDIGIEDYLSGSTRLVIEWPELALPLLRTPVLKLDFSVLPEGLRKIVVLEAD